MGLVVFWLPKTLIDWLTWGVIAVAFIASVIIILKLYFRGKPYLFEIILMKPGVNEHLKVRSDKLEFTHEYKDGEKEKTLEIKSNRLYRLKPSTKEKIVFWFCSIKNKFLVTFRATQRKPVDYPSNKVTSRILWEVNESRALDKALREEFRLPLDPKKLIIYLGIIVVGIVAYLVLTGQVKLN